MYTNPLMGMLICVPISLSAMNMEQFQKAIWHEIASGLHKGLSKTSCQNAQKYVDYSLPEHIIYQLLVKNDANSSPYILFCCLALELKVKILEKMELTSVAAQGKFLFMRLGKAFEYYAVCQQRQSSLPIDLHFMLEKKAQVLFVQNILHDQKQFLKSEITPLPITLRNSPDHSYITNRSITIVLQEPWRNGWIERRYITTLQRHDALWQKQ